MDDITPGRGRVGKHDYTIYTVNRPGVMRLRIPILTMKEPAPQDAPPPPMFWKGRYPGLRSRWNKKKERWEPDESESIAACTIQYPNTLCRFHKAKVIWANQAVLP